MPHILTADIGATNSRFALFHVDGEDASLASLHLVKEHWFSTQQYRSFPELLSDLANIPQFIPSDTALACLAPAGPIANNLCTPPNIAFTLHTDEVTQALGIPHVSMVNDFVAQGQAALSALSHPALRKHLGMVTIQKGNTRSPDKPVAVLGAGSGCGKALLLPDINRIIASEGGHTLFPFISPEEYAFATFMQKHTNKNLLIGDAVVSGEGLACLFAFHTGKNLPPDQIGPLLVTPGPHHNTVLAWFARFYARTCRDFILDTLALGGLVITGGIATRIPVLQHPVFIEELETGETLQHLLKNLPIWHMQSQQAGLWGAALYALRST